MAPADSQWPLFYQGLQQLSQDGNMLADGNDIEVALQHSEQLSGLFLRLAQHNPASIIAQLNLTPRQLSLGLARIVKMLALGLVFSRGFGWQTRRNLSFLQAILLSAYFDQRATRPQHAQLLLAKALQNFNKQHPMLPLLIASCNVRHQPCWQLHPDGPLLTLVGQLAAQLLPAATSQLSLEQVLAQYQVADVDTAKTNWFGILQRLAETSALPGRFARALQISEGQHHYWFISGAAVVGYQQSLQVYARQFDPTSKTIASETHQLPLSELRLLAPQYFRDADWLELLEHADDVLPAVADVELDDCLNQSLFSRLAPLSLNAQVQQLETQPILSQFLLQAAQQINRQQLPVTRLRHAISMLGQDALSDWVAQAELHQYCSLLANPHHGWLDQLQQCLQIALLQLSDAVKRPISISSAGVIARCACLSIWQLPALHNIAPGRHVQGQLLLGQLVQQHIWQAATYPALFSQLLEHYQQPDWANATHNWHQQQQTGQSILLRLSWQLSLSVFCVSAQNQQRLQHLLSVASAQLALPAHTAGYWQQQLIADSHCYYPLPVM